MTRYSQFKPDRRQHGSIEQIQGFPNERSVLPFIYLGVVMDATDVQRMGRLRVWIPEISGEAGRLDESKWFTVSYASPFAGASTWTRLVPDSDRWQDSQQAYGFWAVPVDVGNEVLVAFIGGDPGRGVWFGCLWQQFMNHSVPGPSRGPTLQPLEESCEEEPPTVEYNRSLPEGEEPPVGPYYGDPARPRFDPLHEGLWRQGLYGDHLRGNARESARRDPYPNVFGFTSPRGHSIVIDDGIPETDEEGRPVYDGTQRLIREGSAEYIRFRTRSGTQILISDTDGFVYIITREGNSWIEISDDGIFTYTRGNYDMRVQGDFNLRVDGDFRLEVGGETQIRSTGDMKIHGESRIDIASLGVSDCAGEPGVRIFSDEDVHVRAARDIALTSGRFNDRVAKKRITDLAKTIHHNDAPAVRAERASTTSPHGVMDRELDPERCYPETELECDSIIPQEDFVTHEPWAHPRSTWLDPDAPPEQEVELADVEPEPEELIEDCGRWARIVETAPTVVPLAENAAAVVNSGGQADTVRADVRPATEFIDDPALIQATVERIRAGSVYLDRPVRDSTGRWRVGWSSVVDDAVVEIWNGLTDLRDRRRYALELLENDIRQGLFALLAPLGDRTITAGQAAALASAWHYLGGSGELTNRLVEYALAGEWLSFARTIACSGSPAGMDMAFDTDVGDTTTVEEAPETPSPVEGCPYTSVAPPSDPVISGAIDNAATEFGIDREYLYSAAWIESRFDPDARAPGSSASGLFQITRKTFEDVVERHDLRKPDGTPYRWQDRFDPEVNARVAAALTVDNMESLERRLGRPPTYTELYAAHLLGPANAERLLKAPDDADPYNLFPRNPRRIVDGNPLIFRKGDRRAPEPLKAGEVRAWMATLVEGCGPSAVP